MGKVVLRAYFTKTLYYSSSLFPLLSLFTEVKSCVTCPGTPSIVRVDLFLRAQITRFGPKRVAADMEGNGEFDF